MLGPSDNFFVQKAKILGLFSSYSNHFQKLPGCVLKRPMHFFMEGQTGGPTRMRNVRRAVVYARVSTKNGQSPLRDLREYCRNRNWNLRGEYADKGISGSKDSRPELDRLMKDAHRRQF